MKTYLFKMFVVTVMTLLLICAGWVLFLWHIQSQIPGGHDSLGHFVNSTLFAYALESGLSTFEDMIRAQSARYMPLTYILGGSLAGFSDHSYLAHVLTIMIFWMLAAIFVSVTGWQTAKGGFSSLLPLAVFIANPVVWEAGTSYNLEAALLAGAAIALCLLLFSDSISKAVIVPAMLLLGVFALSKTVLAIAVVPMGLTLLLWDEHAKRKKRAALMTAFIFVAGVWILFKFTLVFRELRVDYLNIMDEEFAGAFYYPALLFFKYRGALLILGLAALITVHVREKSVDAGDAAIGLFFFVPMLFYFLIETRRPWYPLAAYLALPVWFLLTASRLKEKRWVRLTTNGLTAVYLVMAIINICLVFYLSERPEKTEKRVAGIRAPYPPFELEKTVLALTMEDIRQNKRIRVAVDFSRSGLSASRFGIMALMEKPDLAIVGQLVHSDNLVRPDPMFIEGLPISTRFYTMGIGWPEITKEDFVGVKVNPFFEGFAERFMESKGRFEYRKTLELYENETISIFENVNKKATLIDYSHVNMLPADDESEWIDQVRKKGQRSFEAGKFADAAGCMSITYKARNKDYEALFLFTKSLVNLNHGNRSIKNWGELFSLCPSFGLKLEALNFIADAEVNERVDAGTFEQFYEVMANQPEIDKRQLYSLLSAKVRANNLKGDFEGELKVIEQLRSVIDKEQVIGVNIQQALTLKKLGRLKKAESFLRKNLSIAEKTDIGFSDSALHLSEILLQNGRLEEAVKLIELAINGKYDPNFAAMTIKHVAEQYAGTDRKSESVSLLLRMSRKLPAEPGAILQIEIGKSYLADKKMTEAKAVFQKARANVREEGTKKWLDETLDELAIETLENNVGNSQ